MAAAGAQGLPVGYEFVRLLGQGGNGSVTLARHVALDRLVAIKTINPGVQDDDAISRLRREGKAIAALRHPNVVTVFKLIVSSAGVSLVMEHVPGGDLHDALGTGRLSGSDVVRLLSDVAAALGHAHSRGIVHRDVKPANVLLCADGSAKLADFGLARLPRTRASFRTISGTVAGTPMYLAPEQIQNPDLESPGIDAYAYAVLAYEALTGSSPYSAADVTTLIYAHLYGTPIPPWHFAPNLPPHVGEILLSGLAKAAADRPTPEQLAACLRTVPPADWDSSFAQRAAPPSRPGAVSDGPDDGFTPGTSTPMFDHESALDGTTRDAWVQPSIYLPPSTRPKRSWPRAPLIGAVIGIVVGLAIAAVLLYR